MKFTDALRQNIEIYPRETREQFMVRYMNLQPVSGELTLGSWRTQLGLSSSLSIPAEQRALIWDDVPQHLSESIAVAVNFAKGMARHATPESVHIVLVSALFAQQELLRAVRLADPVQADGIGDIDPDAVATAIMSDLEKANSLFDQLEHPDKPRQR